MLHPSLMPVYMSMPLLMILTGTGVKCQLEAHVTSLDNQSAATFTVSPDSATHDQTTNLLSEMSSTTPTSSPLINATTMAEVLPVITIAPISEISSSVVSPLLSENTLISPTEGPVSEIPNSEVSSNNSSLAGITTSRLPMLSISEDGGVTHGSDLPLRLDSEEDTSEPREQIYSVHLESDPSTSSHVPLETTTMIIQPQTVTSGRPTSGRPTDEIDLLQTSETEIGTTITPDNEQLAINGETANENPSYHNFSISSTTSVWKLNHIIPTSASSVITTTRSHSTTDMHTKWTWFYMVLKGNCRLVNLNDSEILFSDFTRSVAFLLLYDKDHIVVDSISCLRRKMTVNMSIDSVNYPNCEEDMRTLLSHTNIRINLHNTSFYIKSFETKKSSIFETKPGTEDSRSSILLMTLGGVGIALICIIFAGILFAVFQCIVVKNTRRMHSRDARRYQTESPRSFRPKFEVDQSVKFSDSRTYSVNMYKSYSDLSAPDLYMHLDSPEFPGVTREHITTPSDFAEKNPRDKKKKKKKKKANPEDTKFEDMEGYHELWSETITQTSEEFTTIRNTNDMTSSFKNTDIEYEDEEMLDPLLLNGVPHSDLKNSENFPSFDPPPTKTCPSSPFNRKDVLKRMDDLISNSSPDINSCNGYATSYTNTTIISSASSAVLTSAAPPATSQQVKADGSSLLRAPVDANTTSSHKKEKPSKINNSTSVDNLCLTRITFMEMRVWPHQNPGTPQMRIRGSQQNTNSPLMGVRGAYHHPGTPQMGVRASNQARSRRAAAAAAPIVKTKHK